MKNYLLFIGDKYYAAGGFDDFYSDYDTIDEAVEALESKIPEDDTSKWGHVLSLSERKLVFERNQAYT